MNNNELSKKDIENIEILIRITKTITNLYQNLYELELNEEKDSQNYSKLIDNLNIALEVENLKYEELNLSSKRCNILLKYLDEKLPQDFSNDIQSIVNCDYDNQIFRRIKRTIIRKLFLFYGDTFLNKDVLDSIEPMTPDSIPAIVQVKWGAIVHESLEIDIFNLCLYFLNKEINSLDNKEIREYLLKTKYYISLIDKDIEENLVEKKFNLEEPINFYTEYQKELNNIVDICFILNKNNNVGEYITTIVKALLVIDDNSLNILKCKVMQIILNCFLKASLVIGDEFLVESINNSFLKILKDKDFYEKYSNSYTGIQIIKKAFLNSKKDRCEIEEKMLDDYKEL